MKRLFIAFLTMALICISALPVLGAGTDERISMDKAKWERINVSTGEETTLTFSKDTMHMGKDLGTYIMKYDKLLLDSKIRFLFKYENSTAKQNDLICEFYLRDTEPDRGLWDIEDSAYGIRFAQNDVGTKAFFTLSRPGVPNNYVRDNNQSMIIKDFKKNEIVPGKFHEIVIGAVNEKGNVRLTFSIDGVEYINMLDVSSNKITEAGYFCITNQAKADLTIKVAGKNPITTKKPTTTTMKVEPTTIITPDDTTRDTTGNTDNTTSTATNTDSAASDDTTSSQEITTAEGDNTTTTPSQPKDKITAGGVSGGILALIIGETVLLLGALGFGTYLFINHKRKQVR